MKGEPDVEPELIEGTGIKNSTYSKGNTAPRPPSTSQDTPSLRLTRAEAPIKEGADPHQSC